jgi:hypothetical protein
MEIKGVRIALNLSDANPFSLPKSMRMIRMPPSRFRMTLRDSYQLSLS